MDPMQQHRASTTVEPAGRLYPARLRLHYDLEWSHHHRASTTVVKISSTSRGTMTSNGHGITGPQPRLENLLNLSSPSPASTMVEPAGNACSRSTSPALCRLERLCRVYTTAVTTIRQPLGPHFGYAFQLKQESSRTALWRFCALALACHRARGGFCPV
jgi:hypothetical protein